jgi:hypothetical protein
MDDTLFVRLFCDELVRLKLDPKTEPRILLEGRVRVAIERARVDAKLRGDTAPAADTVLADPAASTWLRTTLSRALTRDPVDAANEAEVLARVLAARLGAAG